MKIIVTTENDFVKAEVEEWGYDYVEAQYAHGYEPALINGVWCWSKTPAKAITFDRNTSTIANKPIRSDRSNRFTSVLT